MNHESIVSNGESLVEPGTEGVNTEEFYETMKRANRALAFEKSMRDKLVMLQDAQKVDLDAYNELQLRINARAVVIEVITKSLEEE